MTELPSIENLFSTLQKSRKEKNLGYAKHLYSHICSTGLESHRAVGNHIVPMLVECGSVYSAQQVFNRLIYRNEHSWTSLILGYIECGKLHHAFQAYEKMQDNNVHPSEFTLMALLKACGRLKDLARGREVHVDVAQMGFERDVFVGNTMVDMYAKCGSFTEAREVLAKLPVGDVVSWTALIAGYAEHGLDEESLKCFELMQHGGISPNAFTFASALKAYGSLKAITKGQALHMDVVQKGFENDVFVGSALVDVYAKCGCLQEAQEVFEKLPSRDVVLWTALIAGYAEYGSVPEVLKCFEQMQLERASLDGAAYVCLLKAFGSIGALEKGRELHGDVAQKGLETGLSVGNTLVDMYAKCGSLSEARDVFDKLPIRDVVSWSAMITGYGLNHEGDLAVQCYEDMLKQGVKPDDTTFTCLLTACGCAKLVCKGLDIFNLMREEYGFAPTQDHYARMVDLLAQSGDFIEAERYIEKMPCPSLWTSLLSACKSHGEAELGLRCFRKLLQWNPGCAAPYALMAKIYATAGRWDDAYRIEKLRDNAGAVKKPGSASIEVNKMVHEFVVGNNRNKEISVMLEILSSRMKEEGHVPSLNMVL